RLGRRCVTAALNGEVVAWAPRICPGVKREAIIGDAERIAGHGFGSGANIQAEFAHLVNATGTRTNHGIQARSVGASGRYAGR
ncbi:MAG: hypothetical protein OEQ18_18450, partial [Gammaproteobacteria bacterium]|nr:hypothetical protein [Gammaproteobacteria bacterium]